MKHLILIITTILFLMSPGYVLQTHGMDKTSRERFNCSPKIKAVKLELIKKNSQVKLNESVDFVLEMSALKPVVDVMVNFDFSEGIKINNKPSQKFPKLDSGITKVIPFSVVMTKNEFQNVNIRVNGELYKENSDNKLIYNTGKDIGFLYDN